ALQVRFQSSELLVRYPESHIEFHFTSKGGRDSLSLQNHLSDFRATIVVDSIMPLNCRRSGKLEISADEYVWSSPLHLIVARRKRIESDLKNLSVDRIDAVDEFGLETEPHGFHERCCSVTRHRSCPIWNQDAIGAFTAAAFGTSLMVAITSTHQLQGY